MAAGVLQVLPAARLVIRPVADGGEGTLDTLHVRGASLIDIQAADALGVPKEAQIARWQETAYIELATICGIEQLSPTATTAQAATSVGLGQAILAAGQLGVSRIVVTLGGSASTDGGAGLLAGLGFHFHDESGRRIIAVPEKLDEVWSITPGLENAEWSGTELVVASDVDSPLLGSQGAALVFGPQKGADPATVSILESRLTRWSQALHRSFGVDPQAVPGGGAAGGIAAGLHVALGAKIVPGADYMLELLGLGGDLNSAHWVLTGEGSLDAQSLAGKAPVRVAELAREAKVPSWAIAGRLDLEGNGPFERVASLTEAARPDEDTFADAAKILTRVAASMTIQWADDRWPRPTGSAFSLTAL